MPGYENKEGTGTLFVNQNKSKDSQPDYTGNCKIDGKVMRIAGWKNQSKKDPSVSLLGLKFEVKEDTDAPF
tara:strand:- start:501 stop:713 length:213 start_codon:yes stop_codon:yes gene_type:complete